jgi:hypothetical protein
MAADDDTGAPEYQPTSHGPLFDTYDWLAGEIADDLPLIGHVQQLLTEALQPFLHAVHANADHDDPVQLSRSRIVNQANNDFLDLLYESMSGRGRPAVRSARSLFEHMVNHRWITAHPTEAERYWDHRAIGDLLDLELNTPREEDFTGKKRKRVRHWRAKLERRVRPAADAVIAKYGTPFRRSWSTTPLRDRADALGLGGEYDFYRLLSAVIHGAAGGDLGHRAEIGGAPVVRTGPALSACPLAFRVGLRYYRTLVADVGNIIGSAGTFGLEAVLDDLEGIVVDHEQRCLGIDSLLWPNEPPRATMFLRVEVDGTWTWLLLDGEEPKTVVADLVDPDPVRLQRLEDLVTRAEAANPGRTQPLVVGVEGIQGIPRPGEQWRPAEETLRRAQAPGQRPVYGVLQVKEPLWDPSLHY